MLHLPYVSAGDTTWQMFCTAPHMTIGCAADLRCVSDSAVTSWHNMLQLLCKLMTMLSHSTGHAHLGVARCIPDSQCWHQYES